MQKFEKQCNGITARQINKLLPVIQHLQQHIFQFRALNPCIVACIVIDRFNHIFDTFWK